MLPRNLIEEWMMNCSFLENPHPVTDLHPGAPQDALNILRAEVKDKGCGAQCRIRG